MHAIYCLFMTDAREAQVKKSYMGPLWTLCHKHAENVCKEISEIIESDYQPEKTLK